MSSEMRVTSADSRPAPPKFERTPTIGLSLNRKPVSPSEPVARSAVGKLPKVSFNFSKLPILTANTKNPCTVKLSKITPMLEFTVTEKPTLRSPSKSDISKSTEVKVVLEAMKTKRKRYKHEDLSPKSESVQSNHKKSKRNCSDLEKKDIKTPQKADLKTAVEKNLKPGKRTSICIGDYTSRTPKIFKNNEILSSYSSLGTPKRASDLGVQLLTSSSEKKGKSETNDTALSEIKDFSNNSVNEFDTTIKSERLSGDDESGVVEVDGKLSENERSQAPKLKKERVVYRLPDYLNSMEEYERDCNRAKDRLRSYLSAIKTVSSSSDPSSQEKDKIKASKKEI